MLSIEEAINNLKRGKCIPYKHETLTLVIKSLETLRDITVLFDQWTSGELNDGQYHFQMQNLILFGKKLAEVQNESTDNG